MQTVITPLFNASIIISDNAADVFVMDGFAMKLVF